MSDGKHSPETEALAQWLDDWVQKHSGTDLRDAGHCLVLECRCGADLGIHYGPTGRGDDKTEARAYFRHQAADLLAALLAPPASPGGDDRG